MGLVELHVHAEAPLEPVDRDLDVDLAHPREQLVAGLRVAAQDERRVLLGEPPQRACDLLLVALRLRRHREAHHRLREVELRRLDSFSQSSSRSPVVVLLQLRDRADVAGAELLRLLVILALEHEQLARRAPCAIARVHYRRVGVERAGEDAEQVDAAREGVRHGLEDERCGAGAVDVDRRRAFRGRRDAFDEQVEQRRGAEVLRRHPAGDREELAASDRVLEGVRNLFRAELLSLEVPLHQALVGLDHRVEQLGAVRSTSSGAPPGSRRRLLSRSPSGLV